jgi:hypothetical protein
MTEEQRIRDNARRRELYAQRKILEDLGRHISEKQRIANDTMDAIVGEIASKQVAQFEAAPVVEGVGPDAPVVTTEQGGKHSDSPYRLDVVPPKALLAIAAVLKEGMAKYGLDNWRAISQREHLNHALVHVYAHLAGDQSDSHLTHAACRLLFALETQ